MTLHVLRLAVATVPVFGEVGWSGPLEVCAGDVVEHQVWPKAEEVAETVIESQLDLFFGGQELIESTVPGFQLAEVNADPVMLMPVWEKTSTLAVTHEVGLEPASQTMFAAGMDQAIGDQHKCSIDEGDTFSFAEVGFENRPETELCEQGTDGEYRSPGGGIEDLWVRRQGVLEIAFTPQEPSEFGKDLSKQILATQVSDDALLNLAVFTEGLDGTDVLVDCAVGGPDFDGSEVHAVEYHDIARENQAIKYETCRISLILSCHYDFCETRWSPITKRLDL